jgi:DNA-binding MarR family transcriptional regulator
LNAKPATGGAASGVERTWTDEESQASFEMLGDRLIDATRRWSRSQRRQRLQHALYTFNTVELALSQVDALEVLSDNEMRMHELADRLHIDPSTATRTTAPLVDLGLLEREPDPTDRRYVLVRCTPSGRATAIRIAQGRRQLGREVMAPMSPERRLLLADLLEEWLDLLECYRPPGEDDATVTVRPE